MRAAARRMEGIRRISAEKRRKAEAEAEAEKRREVEAEAKVEAKMAEIRNKIRNNEPLTHSERIEVQYKKPRYTAFMKREKEKWDKIALAEAITKVKEIGKGFRKDYEAYHEYIRMNPHWSEGDRRAYEAAGQPILDDMNRKYSDRLKAEPGLLETITDGFGAWFIPEGDRRASDAYEFMELMTDFDGGILPPALYPIAK